VKGLLLDYGGVMTSPIGDSFTAFCTSERIQLDDFRRVMSGAARTADSPFAKVERGAITEEEFDVAVAGLLSNACGRTIASEGLKRRMFAGVVPDLAMHEAVRRARAAGVHTVLVSNSWGGRDYPLDDLRPLFDALVISGEVGMRKPDADIYLFAADKAGVSPAECVFVDDFQVNVDGAEAVGMTGVLQRDTNATLQRLEKLLELPLR
jgi:epoxide hydrolase-like predicted phosphatase